MSTAAIVGGSLAAAGVSAGASMYGASKQADAAKSAAELQHEDQQASLKFQQKEFDTTQANEAPFIAQGQKAVNQLGSYANFVPPTPGDVASEPGYQFIQQQGLDAINKEAAATGNVFSGSTLTAADKFNTGLADTTYNEAYNRALGTYNVNLNRLQSLAGEGQTAVGQEGQFGQQAASNVGAIDVASGKNIATELNNAAAAEASGYVGAANAFTGATNSLSQYAMLNQVLNSRGLYPGNYMPPGVGLDTGNIGQVSADGSVG